MGGSSKSSTQRTYNTSNTSIQGEGNVYGTGNRVTIQRADAITLDKTAKALADGVEDVTEAGRRQTEAALSAGRSMTGDAFSTARSLTSDSLNTTQRINRDSLDAMQGVSRDSLSRLESVSGSAIDLARQVAQGAEQGTQQAMDFVSNFTEREQVGNAGEATRTVMWVAAVAGITLVGIAWASKGGLKA